MLVSLIRGCEGSEEEMEESSVGGMSRGALRVLGWRGMWQRGWTELRGPCVFARG